jgi:hypothetical protein
LHFLIAFSSWKRDLKKLQFARLANWYRSVFMCVPSFLFHAINNGYWQLGRPSRAWLCRITDTAVCVTNRQAQSVIPARSQIRYH